MRRSPRRAELGLLILAWAIGSVCYATVDLATVDTLPANYLGLLIGSAAVLAAQMADGRLRPLVQLAPARLPALAVPTSAEAGFPDFLAETWWGVLGPAGVPAAAVAAMHAATAAAFRAEATARLITGTQQAALRLDGPAPMARFLADQTARWTAVIREHRITAD